MAHSLEQQQADYQEQELRFPPWHQMIILFLIILLSTIGGVAILAGISLAKGLDLPEVLANLDENSTASMRNFVRSSMMINHLTMFVIPCILFSFMFFKSRWKQFLRLDRSPRFTNWFGGFMLLLVSFPLIQYTFYINKEWIPIPEMFRAMEENTEGLIKGMLASNSAFEFLFNTLVIAVIPAIGEEIFFRGLLQGKMMESFKNPVWAIWLTAIFFSAFHLQFEGFIPRLLLGALLGYLFYWTKNLWVPIIAHFLNNFIQIAFQFFYSNELSEVDISEIETVPAWQALLSLTMVVGVGYFLWNYNKSRQPKTIA